LRKATLGSFIACMLCATHVSAATYTPTGFIRDAIDMTAALINPPGVVTGTVDATGCNIGVYYDGGHNARVAADVFGSNYFGILVNTDNGGASNITITGSVVHHIGEVPHNGTQHGAGIYLRGFAGAIKGIIDSNWVFDYQKSGITANGSGVDVDITNNVVTGDGHVTFIAQNGIQMAFGASSNTIAGNYVYGNSFIGFPGDGSSSTGILIAGGPGVGTCPPVNADCGYDLNLVIRGNTLVANDVGVYVFNGDASGNPPATRTNVSVLNNIIYGDICYNQSYQAGVTDVGNRDKIIGNTIYGPGYTACASGTRIDVSDATDPTVKNTPPHRPHMYGNHDGDD